MKPRSSRLPKFDDRSCAKSILLRRLFLVYLILLAGCTGLISRLVYLQIFQHHQYRLLARTQQGGFIELAPRRGAILDRHLEELAVSVRADSVSCNPKQVRDPLKAARQLATLLSSPAQDLYEKLVSEKTFVYLKRKIDPRVAQQVRRLELPGIFIHEESRRVYPSRELASHVLGFVGVDNEGLGGIEYLYDTEIAGRKEKIQLRFDARRTSFARDGAPSQWEGNTLVLTIDHSIQYVTERALRKAVRSSGAVSGSAVVMVPDTGEILAMASVPTFDPNNYTESGLEEQRNRAILDIYEPGSTFKIITLAAVLNEGLSHPEEVIDCRVDSLRLAGKQYREAHHSFEDLSFNEILARSSNVGTIKLGLRLGNEKLYDYMQRFGFGVSTGIGLPAEQSGLLRPPSQWSRISIGALSIGQEIGVTPLQMVTAMSALANGGNLVQPFMLKQILTPQGDLRFQSQVSRRAILKKETAEQMKRSLALVVEEGTGARSQLNGYSSAGKTGTAQKIVDGRYSQSKYVASFVGFAPLNQPALSAIVVIDEPRGIYYGGHVAAPAFKEIMEQALIHLQVPQDRREERQLSRPELARSESSGTELEEPAGVSIREDPIEMGKGLEETVLSLLDHKRKEAPTVTVELDSVAVPDFSGKSLREVARQCARLGLKLKISGNGVAVGQRPRPGLQVLRGAVCEVFFSNSGQNFHDSQTVAFRDSGGLDQTGQR